MDVRTPNRHLEVLFPVSAGFQAKQRISSRAGPKVIQMGDYINRAKNTDRDLPDVFTGKIFSKSFNTNVTNTKNRESNR